MMAQINVIPNNGMIPVPFLHRPFMDGLGGATVMELWATFCRGDNRAETTSGEMMNRGRLMFGTEAGPWEGFPEYVNGSETYESGQRHPVGRREADRPDHGYSLPTYFYNSLASFFKKRLPALLVPAANLKETSSAPQLPKDVDTDTLFISCSKLATLKSVLSASVASVVQSPSDSHYISTNDALGVAICLCH